QAMRIRQIRFRDQPLLRVSTNTTEAGYPLLGGAYEACNPHLKLGQLVEQPDARTVVMDAVSESGTSAKAFNRKTLSFEEQGVIRIAMATRSASLTRTYRTAGGSAKLEITFDRRGDVPV